MAKKELAKETESVVSEYDGQVTMPSMANPKYDNLNEGTIAIETGRAVAEAQGKLIIAKRFPRDETIAYTKAMEACRRVNMASRAFYSYPKGGSVVSGASIKFAQELARCWGNIDYGIKELSRDDKKSEMQAYAWDMETNTISVQNFTNPHQREVKQGMVKLTSDRDIYENNANMATRRLRARILAVLPDWLIEDCIIECKRTLNGDTSVPMIDKARQLVTAFAKHSVTKEMIEKRLGHTLETMTQDEYLEYVGIGNNLKDKQSTVADWFEQPKVASEATDLLDMAMEKSKKGE